MYPQAGQATELAYELWGPAGALLALLIIGAFAYLLARNKTLRRSRTSDHRRELQAAEDYAEDLRDLEVETLNTLRDVTELLDKLETSDQELRKQVEKTGDRIETRVDRLHDHLRNS
jgi:gas vesicle protein